MQVGIGYPIKYMTNGLTEGKPAEFWFWLVICVSLSLLFIPLKAVSLYSSSTVRSYLREAVSEAMMDLYMKDMNFYHIQNEGKIDNPGQRIDHDACNPF